MVYCKSETTYLPGPMLLFICTTIVVRDLVLIKKEVVCNSAGAHFEPHKLCEPNVLQEPYEPHECHEPHEETL